MRQDAAPSCQPREWQEGTDCSSSGREEAKLHTADKRSGQVSALSRRENSHFEGFGIGCSGSEARVHHHGGCVTEQLPLPRKELGAESGVTEGFSPSSSSLTVAIVTNGTLEQLPKGLLFYPYSSSTKNLSVFSSNLPGGQKDEFQTVQTSSNLLSRRRSASQKELRMRLGKFVSDFGNTPHRAPSPHTAKL